MNQPQAIPTQVQTQSSGLATASLVCGICGFVLGPVTGIPAIITGHMALSQIKKSGEVIQGKSMAMAGLIMGYFTTVLMALLATAGFAAGNAAIQKAKKTITLATEVALESAVNNFVVEYGTMPKAGEVDAVVKTDTDMEFLKALLGSESSGPMMRNPRSIRFLSAREGKEKKNGLIYSQNGDDIEGLYDPWGGPYHVVLDLNNDAIVTVPQSTGGSTTLKGRRVAVWSDGPDRKPGTNDDVTSW